MAEISIELKLAMADAINQAKAAAAAISKEFGLATSKGTTAATSPAAVAGHDKETAAIQKKTKALTENQKAMQKLRDIASGKISPPDPEDWKVVDVSAPTSTPKEKHQLTGEAARRSAATPPDVQAERDQRAAELRAERAEKRRAVVQAENFAFGQANRDKFAKWQDVPPILPKAAAGIPTAPKSTALNGTLIRSLVGSIAGSTLAGPIGAGLGASAMGAGGPFAIGIAAVTAAMKMLKSAIHLTIEAFQRSQQIYNRAMTSGFGLGMATKRSNLAAVMGVSEEDLFQFGKQIEYIGNRTDAATRIMAANATQQNQVVMDWKILKVDMEALASIIASAVAPSVDKLINSLSLLAEGFIGVADTIIGVVKYLLKSMLDIITNFSLGPIMGTIVKTIGAELLNLANLTATGGRKLTEPNAYMKQMPASAWERMGLQIGVGSGTNYNQQTANHTKPVPELLRKIAVALTAGNKFNIAIPSGHPAAA